MRTRRSVRPAPALAGVLLAAALAVTGCSGAGGDSGGSLADDKAAVAPAPGQEGARDEAAARDGGAKPGAPGGSADGAPAATPKVTADHVVRTASLTVRVKDVPKALEEARTAAEDAGGYVGDETTRRDAEGHEHTRVVLRVPVAGYAEVLAGLEGAGELVERRAKAEDVTDQVVDVDSRVASQRASVARVRELMDRATKLSDVVTLEGELSTRQADLESLLAQQTSLKDRTGLATITLSLSGAPADPGGKDDDGPGFVDALAGGWDAFVTVLRWLTVAIGAVLPFAALAALLVLLWVKALRPLLRRRRQAGDVAPATAPVPVPAWPGGGQENRTT